MKLVELYKEGSVLEGLEKAKAELTKSIEQGKNKLPEVIICEARFDFATIHHFNLFLRKHSVLCSIPLILDVSGLGSRDVALYRKHARPDEMLFIEDCDKKDLASKIKFLCKMKAHSGVNGTETAEAKIEEKSLRSLRFGPMTKRGFDILVASVALLLLSPLLLLIALAIRLESRGPIFYIAKRAGRGYKIFNFYKFRTMIHGADKKMTDLAHLNQYNTEKAPVFFKINNDPRITKVGSFLRNTSLDELPQLVNVLLGDMSLVGNRPLPLYEAKNLTTDDFAARFMAPAGITGLWQVKKRGTKEMSVEERISLDIDYASNCNFVTDLWIIANTPGALLQKENV